GLSLVRHLEDPPYGVRCDGDRMDFILGGAPVVTARRAGDTLLWEEYPCVGPDGQAQEEPRASVASTFALSLAVAGWPLIRGPAQWEHRYGWSDTGMPEGLAYKITVFEGYARHCGLRINTPRIPGLVYPDWEDL
ncbi:hypothetical protein, partial [uncultured Thiodictyon sp.]|uniref:hypothetical protein n=1 Tax=uncultured Thiodictyon sp. TaxID=1846217 RepID=UPI0025EF46B7